MLIKKKRVADFDHVIVWWEFLFLLHDCSLVCVIYWDSIPVLVILSLLNLKCNSFDRQFLSLFMNQLLLDVMLNKNAENNSQPFVANLSNLKKYLDFENYTTVPFSCFRLKICNVWISFKVKLNSVILFVSDLVSLSQQLHSRGSTRIFSGQGRFRGIRALQLIFQLQLMKERPHSENVRSFFT